MVVLMIALSSGRSSGLGEHAQELIGLYPPFLIGHHDCGADRINPIDGARGCKRDRPRQAGAMHEALGTREGSGWAHPDGKVMEAASGPCARKVGLGGENPISEEGF